MNKHIIELTDDEIQSIENGDGINDGIYSITYEEHRAEEFDQELYGKIEGIGYLQWLGCRYENAERTLKAVDNQIIGLIGKDAYLDIIDLFKLQQLWLKRDIKEIFTEYDDLNN
jgi:hypothetical protein